jgi:thiamine pyrophosphate-dependent acetolactate synthase large subunit-like protein
MNGAELLIECLKKENVEIVSGYSGRPLLAILQALRDSGIRGIQTRHEQGAGFLADGYARVSRRPGVVIVQRGPGATNCLTAIANAQIDGIPLIVLIGQGEMGMFGKGALQELDHLAFLPYFTKWCFRVPSINRIPEIIRRAFTVAQGGKPGPVAIELPMDLMESSVDDPVEAYWPSFGRLKTAGDPRGVLQAVEVLLRAESPVVYAGAGVVRSGAEEELFEFADAFGIPVMTSLPGKSAFPEDHELSLGLGGFPKATYGTRQAHRMVDKADCVLALGASFKEHGTRYFMPRPLAKKLIQVDICEDEISKNYPADIAIVGDIKLVLRQFMDAGRGMLEIAENKARVANRRAGIAAEISAERKEWMKEWEARLQSDAKPIDPYRVTTELARALDPRKSIILHDAGLVRAYICHHYVCSHPGSFVGFGGFSAMGYSVPAAIGAKVAAPDKDVVTIVGDGSFGMTGFEIETAVRYGIKTITLVYNNQGVDAVKTLQKKRGEKIIWDYLGGNYAQIAGGMGAYGLRVEVADQIAPALEAALSQEKPAVIELDIMELVPTPNYP